MATFGAAVVSDRYAADVLTAVDDIMSAAQIWITERQLENKPILNVAAAVTIGPIIFGAVGDATRMEYTVIGDAVNLAAKLEKHAKVETVRALCTALAYETALRQGYRPPAERKKLNRRTIEGVAELQDIVILAE